MPLRSKTSPNSSSISRRMRSKLAKMSRSGMERRLEGVDGSLARELDVAAERLDPGGATRVGVQLVGVMRQHDPARSRPAAVLAGLAGSEVPALAGALGSRQ